MAAINWSEAMEQVGGDEEFLNEVLQDLITESDTASTEISDAIAAKDFEGVKQAGHRIKGSASYLSCDALKNVSYELQEAGHAGTKEPTDEQLEHIKDLYVKFQQCLSDLKEEIENHNKK